MGLRKMDFSEWIELDNEYLSYHAQKAARIPERGEKCCYTAPEALPAAYELLAELADFLPARYPALFARTAAGLDNLATGERFDIVARPLAEDPLAMAARWVQDDLALMLEGGDGTYYLRAGATLLTGFWRLQDKLGMSLDAIHQSGDVPGFAQRLQKGMDSFFTRIQPDGPMLRNNYFIQVDGELAWSSSIGPEDAPAGGFGWFSAEKNKPVEQIYLRCERQSLRRLPKSGAVVRAYPADWCRAALTVGRSSPSARISIRLSRWPRSRMCRADLRARSEAGMRMWPSIRVSTGTASSFWRTWTSSTRSRCRRD